MKRIFACIIAALFALAIFGTASAQAEELPPLATPIIPTLEFKTGEEFEVPLLVDDVTGHGYISFQGNLTVDPKVLRIINIRTRYGETVAWTDNVHHNFVVPGAGLYFAAANYREWEGSGPLFFMVLKAVGKPGESSSVVVGNLLLNEEEFPLIIGKVNIHKPVVSGQAFYRGDTTRQVPNVAYRLSSPVKDYGVTSPTGAFSFSVEPETYQLYALKVSDYRDAITAYDAALVMRCAIQLASNCHMPSSDAYQDGELTAYDAALILRHSVGFDDSSGLSAIGGWIRTDAFRHPIMVNDDAFIGVDFTLVGDVSGNWGTIPVTAALAASSPEVFVQNGQLVIQSNEQFISVEITVEGNTTLLGVDGWSFQKNDNKVAGYANGTPTSELRIPMDGRVSSVRLDEYEPVLLDLQIGQSVPVFLPLTWGQ